MRLGKELKRYVFPVIGFMLAMCIFGLPSLCLAKAAERPPVSMSRILNIPNVTHIYDSLSIKIKAAKAFKISLQLSTASGDCWITYSSTDEDLSYDPMDGIIKMGIGKSLVDGKWHTVERNISLDLEEACLSFGCCYTLRYINKIDILGSDFGVRYINVFYEEEVNGWPNRFPQTVSNFGTPDIQSMEDPLEALDWEVSDESCFILQYDENLNGYIQALGPLPEEEDDDSSKTSSSSTVYSPTDLGSTYSPYSATGGYYDNFYGPMGYGFGYGMSGMGYGMYGMGMGMGYGMYGMGMYSGLGLGGLGLGGYGYSTPYYGLGSAFSGYGSPYSSYGYPYSLYGGALNGPLGLSSLLGSGLGVSPLLGDLGLLGSLGDLPTTTLSIPTLVPSTNNLSLSSIFGGLGISLSDITIPVTTFIPGVTSLTIPDVSTLLSLD